MSHYGIGVTTLIFLRGKRKFLYAQVIKSQPKFLTVRFRFECQDCGFVECIDNPVFVEKRCPQKGCKGTMKAYTVAVSKDG